LASQGLQRKFVEIFKKKFEGFFSVLGIRGILVRIQIRIPGSVSLTNGSGSGCGPTPDLTPFFANFKDAKEKYFLSYFFLITCPHAHHLQSKKFNFLLRFCVKILFYRHYFSPLNTLMRKREGSGRHKRIPNTNFIEFPHGIEMGRVIDTGN
jgi:hypothetical protein